MSADDLDLDALADVLRRVDELDPVDVALGVALAGVPVVAVAPGGKGPLLTRQHVHGVNRDGERVSDPCDTCAAEGLGVAGGGDHNATTDPSTIRSWYSAHPDAGVGMKNHPRLLRVDLDCDDGPSLTRYRTVAGFTSSTVPDPFEARTPGGQYRRRHLHHVDPEDGALAGGGTHALGVSFYGTTGYVVIKGTHPKGGTYGSWRGAGITPPPPAVLDALRSRRRTTTGPARDAATSGTVSTFLGMFSDEAHHPELLGRRVDRVLNADHGARHSTATNELRFALRDAVAGYYSARTAVERLREAFSTATAGEARDPAEFDGMLSWAVGQVAHLDGATARQEAEADWAVVLWSVPLDVREPPPEDDGAVDLDVERLDEAGQLPTIVGTPDGHPVLPDEFWTARPVLGHIQTAARARMMPPDTVLGAVLAWTATATDFRFVLPPIVGGRASLNVIVGVVGKSGAGKGRSLDLAAELLPETRHGDDATLVVPAGSGEGMVRAFYEDRPEEDGSKVMRPTFVRRHVLFRVDEVDQLTAVAGRQGQTTLPLLRSAWSGEELGNSYASREKSLKVPSLQYRCAVVVGVQPTRAGELLDDTGGGTAQRVLWLLNGDPDAPDELPEWPGRLDVTVPRWDPDKATRSAGPRVTPLAVADSVAEEIRRHRRAVLRLAAESDHRDLQRLKVAALLAVLDGRLDVNGEDWSLAGIVLDTSDKVRDHIAQERARESEDEADRSGHRAGRRALAAQTVSEDVERIARLIWRHLGDGPLRPSVVKNQKVAHRDRPNFDAALKLARARGWVVDLGNGEVGQGAQPQERAA